MVEKITVYLIYYLLTNYKIYEILTVSLHLFSAFPPCVWPDIEMKRGKCRLASENIFLLYRRKFRRQKKWPIATEISAKHKT